jgi:FMN reductase
MTESTTVNILAVAGSLQKTSVTRAVINILADQLRASGCSVDVLDLNKEPMALFNPDQAREAAGFAELRTRVERADVIIIGTPDYHGSLSSATKNFLDHFWHEFAGKLFVPVVASHEKGLTVMDQLRTVARQCYAWALPYGVAFMDGADVKHGEVVSDSFRNRLTMLVRDVRVYGELLARQRREDLAGTEPGFLAKHRK